MLRWWYRRTWPGFWDLLMLPLCPQATLPIMHFFMMSMPHVNYLPIASPECWSSPPVHGLPVCIHSPLSVSIGNLLLGVQSHPGLPSGLCVWFLLWCLRYPVSGWTWLMVGLFIPVLSIICLSGCGLSSSNLSLVNNCLSASVPTSCK